MGSWDVTRWWSLFNSICVVWCGFFFFSLIPQLHCGAGRDGMGRDGMGRASVGYGWLDGVGCGELGNGGRGRGRGSVCGHEPVRDELDLELDRADSDCANEGSGCPSS